MSSDRTNTPRQPLRPGLATVRSARTTPLTPRVAGNVTPQARPSVAKSVSSPSVRSEPPRVAPRVKQEQTPTNGPGSVHVTARTSTRKSRLIEGWQEDGLQPEGTPSLRPKSVIPTTSPNPGLERSGSAGSMSSLGFSSVSGNRGRAGRPMSLASNNIRGGPASSQVSPNENVESRFFHANEASKQDLAPKRPEPKKTPSFFYADGKQEERTIISPPLASPVTSVISENRTAATSAPWMRYDDAAAIALPRSPPKPSPALSTVSNGSSFFQPLATPQQKPRSPSPSKENIHLSYRRGVSQIFGTRPTQRAANFSENGNITTPNHRKSPSLSSIDTTSSPETRRKSAFPADVTSTPSPPPFEIKTATDQQQSRITKDLPSIDTNLADLGLASPPPDSSISPTRGASELAVEARRERKVLDLEISNNSLLAINSSLERELRRQKHELKRFRRLSRAGRFSIGGAGRLSEGMSTLGEDDEDDEFSLFSPMMGGFPGMEEEESDDEESITSSEPLSPSAQSRRESDRLAEDEKRLQLDLAQHKELLVQSQKMNQSIRRCMYATEGMIADGQKALTYQVRVSDVKLGGRILSNDDMTDGEDDNSRLIEAEDDHWNEDYSLEGADGLLQVWQGVGRPSYEGSSEGGDRDSGIEVDKPHMSPLGIMIPRSNAQMVDSGRPSDRFGRGGGDAGAGSEQ